MDKSVWLQYMAPADAVARRERCSVLLVPVAPVEWHGPHLPLGCDPLIASSVAERAAQLLGATAYPTLYIGTERERPPKMLRDIGLPDHARIEGMDFPANNYRSFYFREEVFALMLRDVIGMAGANGYRLTYIVNGHGAANQLEVIQRLCAELDAPKGPRVAWGYAFPEALRRGLIAHAAAEETSMLLHLEPESVHLDRLPAADRPLRNADFAIVDGPTFDGHPTPDFTVRKEVDPRTAASPEVGLKNLEAAAQEIARHVQKVLGGQQ